MKQKVQAVCGSCGGTGLYSGMCEPKGTAVVCLHCNGTGCATIEYEQFERRKGKKGIQRVQRSKGTFILSAGPTGNWISYAEFEQGKMP